MIFCEGVIKLVGITCLRDIKEGAEKFRGAVVAGDWLYIDGGTFSFMSEGTPKYQYGKPEYVALIYLC